jgi:hypothetical protein
LGAFTPGKPGEFALPDISELSQIAAGPGTGALSPAETMRIAEQTRGWLAAAELSPAIGSSLAKTIGSAIRTYPQYDAMIPAEQEAHALVERGRVERHWKGETAKNLGLAVALVNEIEAKRPGLKAFLDRTGTGNDHRVIIALGEHARRLAAKVRA